jgi:hypothetical protein
MTGLWQNRRTSFEVPQQWWLRMVTMYRNCYSMSKEDLEDTRRSFQVWTSQWGHLRKQLEHKGTNPVPYETMGPRLWNKLITLTSYAILYLNMGLSSKDGDTQQIGNSFAVSPALVDLQFIIHSWRLSLLEYNTVQFHIPLPQGYMVSHPRTQ